MAASTDDVRTALEQLAGALFADAERIAACSVARMQERLPSYARVPAEALLPVTLTNTRNVLEAVRDPDADPRRAEDHFRISGETRVRQEITADEMLQAWRIGLEVIREEAHPVAERIGIADDVLLEFVESTLQWGDVGMRISAAAHRKAEIGELERLAAEQAALRRVATLVAQDVASEELFGAVAREVGILFGADYTGMIRYEPDPTLVTTMATWAAVGVHPLAPGRSRTVPGDPTAMVADTGKPARVDDWANVPGPIAEFVRRELGVKSSVGSPIVVKGRLWGALAVHSQRGPLLADTESRLLNFTELVATAIANTNARGDVTLLVEEQAALRRVATHVARGAPPTAVFAVVATETMGLLGAHHVVVCRYEPGAELTVLAHHSSSSHEVPPGSRINHEGDSVEAVVRRTARSARVESYVGARGTIAELARAVGVQVAVGAPVVVGGRLWGVVSAGWNLGQPPAADTEERLAKCADLVATAIANAEAQAEVERLAEEQAALRRVATLVAQGAPPSQVLATVAAEMERVLGADGVTLGRYESDEEVVVVAHAGSDPRRLPVGLRMGHRGENVTSLVRWSKRPARLEHGEGEHGALAEIVRDLGVLVSVGAPIVVDGDLWGLAIANWRGAESPPADTEERMAKFADLVATAIANAEARTEVERLAEEQAALRRVATLVAEGAPATAVFDAVAAEVERVLGADGVSVGRYEPNDEVTLVAQSGADPWVATTGARVSIAEVVRNMRTSASVWAPIVVEGRVWGAAIANWKGEESPPADTEERMAKFAELLETAIANADSREQLTASRARLVTEADEARRRVVRDLHDGAQQRLVHAIVTLKLAERALQANDKKAESLVAEALAQAQRGNAELRELAHGILPAVLTQGGLRTGVDTIVARLELPVDVDVPPARFPAEIEASAYFIVAEALTNVVKHSRAYHAEVRTHVEDGMLCIEVRDDGIGGADPHGHGLVGLQDRVTALGGGLMVESPADGGTLLAATLPLSAG